MTGGCRRRVPGLLAGALGAVAMLLLLAAIAVLLVRYAGVP